jgi:hypothetical protein
MNIKKPQLFLSFFLSFFDESGRSADFIEIKRVLCTPDTNQLLIGMFIKARTYKLSIPLITITNHKRSYLTQVHYTYILTMIENKFKDIRTKTTGIKLLIHNLLLSFLRVYPVMSTVIILID